MASFLVSLVDFILGEGRDGQRKEGEPARRPETPPAIQAWQGQLGLVREGVKEQAYSVS